MSRPAPLLKSAPLPEPVRLLVYDYDGTVSNSLDLILGAFRAVFTDSGLPVPDAATLKSVIGMKLEHCFKLLAPDADPVAFSAAYRGRQHQLHRDGVAEHLYPDADSVLRALDGAGYIQSVCSGKNLNALERGLAGHRLADRFFTLHTPDHGASKPSPELLIQAMDRAGAEPENTLVIGDSVYDMLMAKNAGVRAIGVSWGYGAVDALSDAGAAALINRWTDLPARITELIG